METSHGIPRDRDPSRAHPCRDRPRQGPGLRRAWWLYGAALFIVALPHAVLLQPDRQRVEKRQLDEGGKRCPFCAEIIKVEAAVCRYCGRELQGVAAPGPAASANITPHASKSRPQEETWVVLVDARLAAQHREAMLTALRDVKLTQGAQEVSGQELKIASGLSLHQANSLIVRLDQAGVASRKQRDAAVT